MHGETEQSNILDLIDNNEVKRLIQWIKGLYLEVDESEFVNVLRDAIGNAEFDQVLKDAINSILFNANLVNIDEEVAY